MDCKPIGFQNLFLGQISGVHDWGIIQKIFMILSPVSVTKARVWIDESVYWIFTSRNYN
jgi:hypothetical protein